MRSHNVRIVLVFVQHEHESIRAQIVLLLTLFVPYDQGKT